MQWDQTVWKRSAKHLGGYMEPLVKGLGRIERREGATLYVAGLLSPGQRKSVEPMAQRLGIDVQKLQQFISDSPWDEERVWEAIAEEVIPMLGSIDSWMIDETGWIKQGDKSVGVAHQYCGAVGKQANAQVSVHLAVGIGQIAAPVAARLFLPQAWCDDPQQRRRARIPDSVGFATKPEIALDLIRKAKARGIPSAPVLGDCLYGHSGPLRHGLRQLELEYLLQVEPQLVGWTHSPALRKARKNWQPQRNEQPSRDVAQMAREIPESQWVHCHWRAASGKIQKTRLAWIQVWLWSDLDKATGKIPPTWLVVDWPEGNENPYHLYTGWFDGPPELERLLMLSRQRWTIEQYFQRDKDDLGLDHFEGRSWQGFHHHLALAAAAYLFVLLIYLHVKKNSIAHLGARPPRDPAVAHSMARVLSIL